MVADKRYIEEMRELGFSTYEARVYLALLRGNPATAYEVSKAAGLPHANVYRTLDTLNKKGAVQPISQRPVKFVPLAPDQLLPTIAKRTSNACQSLAKRLSELDGGDKTEYVWLVHGLESTQNKILEMIASARQHLWIKAHQNTLKLHYAALKKAAERGVRIVLVFIGDATNAKKFKFNEKTKMYLHEGTGRSGIGGAGADTLTITADFDAALTVDTREDALGAFTRSAPVVNLANTMMRHEFYIAEIFQKFGPEIERTFGPALLKIRRHYLPKHHIEALEDELRRDGMK